jgi:hypothetical protein
MQLFGCVVCRSLHYKCVFGCPTWLALNHRIFAMVNLPLTQSIKHLVGIIYSSVELKSMADEGGARDCARC